MKLFTPFVVPFSLRLPKAWLLSTLVLLLLLGASGATVAQTPLPAYYSTGGSVYKLQQPSPQIAGSGYVAAGLNAADGDFSTFATLKTDVSVTVGAPVGLGLGLTGVAPAGYRAGVLLANASGLLSLQAIGTVTLRTYLRGASPELREEKVVQAELVRAALLATDRPTQLEFVSSKSFDAVEIEIAGLANVLYTTNIYYAYGVRPGVQTVANGYLTRFADATGNYSTKDYTGVACVATDVNNPQNVADADLTNFATFQSLLTVACKPSVRAKVAGVGAGGVPAGYYAGFIIGKAGLLDVGVLSGLRVTTYLNGVLQESFSGTGALELAVLPDGKARVAFPTTKAFNEVGIAREGLLTAVDNLEIYYGFGLASQAFLGLNPVLSNFATPVAGSDYSSSAPQTITVTVLGISTSVGLSDVVNPENAADMDNANFAQLRTTGLGLIGTTKASLRVRLNGAGRAGNRVGMVIGNGAGLLDLTALQRLTLLTYDSNNVLVETKSGSDLLGLGLLPGFNDRSRVWFLATRDFAYVELEVNSAAAVLSNTRVYYAFAEDVPLVSVQYPLPVELTAFSGRWAAEAAELSWATATEKNSSHFVVERSVSGEAGFQAVGQVQAHGTSSSPQAYKLRDADAGAQGVARLYYRLRQVDLDGKQAFSPVITVAVGQRSAAAPQLEVYPNPAPDAQAVWVHCPNLPAAGGTVRTYSELGQLVSQFPVVAGTARLALPALAPGLYQVVLRDAAGQKLATQRLVVGAK